MDSEVIRAKADERHAMRELRQARRVEVPPPARPHAAYPHARTHALTRARARTHTHTHTHGQVRTREAVAAVARGAHEEEREAKEKSAIANSEADFYADQLKAAQGRARYVCMHDKP